MAELSGPFPRERPTQKAREASPTLREVTVQAERKSRYQSVRLLLPSATSLLKGGEPNAVKSGGNSLHEALSWKQDKAGKKKDDKRDPSPS